MRRTRAAATFVAVPAVLFTSYGCGSKSPGADSPNTVSTQTVSGYGVSPRYASALDFSGNDSIFTVRIVSLGPPAVSMPISADDSTTYVFTPISATVLSVLKSGNTRGVRAGDNVTLRILGGEAAVKRTINDITAGPDSYHPGDVVQIFASSPYSDPQTGALQYVPNWSFQLSGDGSKLTNLAETGTILDKSSADLLAQEKAAWAGWQR